jgi:modulator of FtsH protease
MANQFNQYSSAVVRTQESVLATNTVIRNTYILLSLTLLFSAATAAFAMVTNAPNLGLLTLIGYFGLLFATQATRNSGLGIFFVFALTGFMGYTLGPLLNAFLQMQNGAQVIMTALGGTGVIFLSLSAYALTTRKDFSYMTGFMMAASMVLLVGIVANIFLQLPMLQLIIAGGFMVFSSAMILYETSNIIHGGERNYIMATVSLYLAIYNLFISLLQILSVFSNRE